MIAAHERACKDNVDKRSNDQLAKMGTSSNGLTQSKVKRADEQKQRQLSKCTEDAQRAADELFSKGRAEYQSQAEEERDQNALMMILTTSRPH